MDFLENVMSAVGSAAQTVVKKSGEVVEYSKLKYSMFDLSNSIKNLYSQIGEAVYISYKNHTPLDENVKDKCSYITPVPGGVGPLTIASLLENTIIAYKNILNLK